MRDAYACLQGHGAAVTGAMHPPSVQMLIRARPYQASTSATLVASSAFHPLLHIRQSHRKMSQLFAKMWCFGYCFEYCGFLTSCLPTDLFVDWCCRLPLFGIDFGNLAMTISQFEDLTENIIHSDSFAFPIQEPKSTITRIFARFDSCSIFRLSVHKTS